MKKLFFWLTTIASGFVLVACSVNENKTVTNDESWKRVENKKKLVVATSGTLFPSSYYNNENELTGYDVEIIAEVAKRLGLKTTFKEYDVDGQIMSVAKGESDLAANDFSLTNERKEKFDLSSPIKYSFSSMIVRQSDNSGIASLKDLKDKKAAGEPNTNYMKIAEKYGAKLVTYDNATNNQYLTDVARGRTDVILNDYYLQKMSIDALPDIPVKILEGVYLNPNETGFLMKRENVTLRKKINEVLQEMRKDGTMKKLSEEYFQTDVSTKPSEKLEESTLGE
ncbi:transporter substrate-binding domain-containing protein [Enterococcus rivorum]|uniref:ABC transporter substrate-binding protein n=1 Tax=Enterococcus rivorum TaxID=762845 RepID=A0A1E5KSB9_9ENTE|nr:transporter substrate-binding domain-containing protein [Enterococcus rivorum]MBP2097452.1 cystine transport system substrate-binding protein [Enterococcus rivorum]OEH80792.1 ABC transporter substrate-binding protein [Enterococcus rivorum]